MFSLYCLFAFFFLSLLATPFFLVTALLGGLPGLYLLLEGHQLRRNRAMHMGLHHVGTVEAAGENEAMERYLAQLNETEADNSTLVNFSAKTTKSDNLAFGLFPETSS